MAYTYDLDLINKLAAKNDYVTIQVGSYTGTVRTLETVLSQFAATAVRVPNTMRGQDPIQYFLEFAQNQCNAVPTPDCSLQQQLAVKYGQIVKDAMFLGGYPGFVDDYVPLITPADLLARDRPQASTPVSAPSATATPSSAPVQVPATLPAPAATPAPTPPSAPVPAPAPVSQTSAAGGVQPRFISGGAIGGGISIAGTVGLAISGVLTFGISTALGLLGSLLGGLFGGGGGGDVNALRQEVQQLKQDLAKATHEIGRFAWSIGFGLGNLVTALAGIWDNFFDQLWARFKNVWKVVWDTVATVIPKIIETIKKVRQKLDEIYAKYILKIMRWLQFARRWLGILRALHVPFASKLDRILGQIQSALYLPMQYMLRWLGGLVSWYNLLVAWDYTIQRPIFLRTMYKYQGDWINMFYTAQAQAGGSVLSGSSADDLPGETPQQAATLLARSLGTPLGDFVPPFADTPAALTANILGS